MVTKAYKHECSETDAAKFADCNWINTADDTNCGNCGIWNLSPTAGTTTEKEKK